MAEIHRNRLQWESDDGNTYIFDKNLGATVVGQEVYSEDEIVVGKWIDGKPNYRKVFKSRTAGTKGTWTTINVDSNVETFTKVYGLHIGGVSSDAQYAIDFTRASASLSYGLRGAVNFVNKTVSVCPIESDAFNRDLSIVVEYTKTSDAPNSYKPTNTELTKLHKTGETFDGYVVYEGVYKFTGNIPVHSKAWGTFGNLSEIAPDYNGLVCAQMVSTDFNCTREYRVWFDKTTGLFKSCCETSAENGFNGFIIYKYYSNEKGV